MEIRGHGGITHFGNSEGMGGVKMWKSSVVWYGYFLELPIVTAVHLRVHVDRTCS